MSQSSNHVLQSLSVGGCKYFCVSTNLSLISTLDLFLVISSVEPGAVKLLSMLGRLDENTGLELLSRMLVLLGELAYILGAGDMK